MSKASETDIGTRGMSIEGLKDSRHLNGPAWFQTDEENWPRPWCQVNEVKAEQVTSTVARETELEQLFDWKRYSTFNRIKKNLLLKVDWSIQTLITMQNIQYCWQQNIQLYNFCWRKHIETT